MKHFFVKNRNVFILSFVFLIALALGGYYFFNQTTLLSQKNAGIMTEKDFFKNKLDKLQKDIIALKNEDQYKINKALEAEIKNIEETYKKAVTVYESLVKLKELTNKTEKLDSQFAQSLTYLSQRNFASGEAELTDLTKKIADERSKIVSAFILPANVAANNTPPGAGYQKQIVKTDVGDFLVDIVSADMNSTRVIVDTASDSDCRNDCPVLSLADYVGRNGAYAGINGSYFCPASYPSCADKKNAFDTLVMNKNKTYFNSDNNVYSTVPAVIFQGNSARFVGQSLEWGRDTSVDGVIANQPLLVSNGQVAYGGDDEVKRLGKGTRSFVGSSGSTVYIGVVYNANAAEMARVLAAMGMQNALNLDSGGSTALWSGRYIVGPGRNIPNAILFVRK